MFVSSSYDTNPATFIHNFLRQNPPEKGPTDLSSQLETFVPTDFLVTS